MITKNSTKYNFKDFTLNHYKEILSLLKTRHEFISFDAVINSSKNFVLNRHDVDFSVENALQIAQIESKFEAKSTYFLLLHSEFYSFLEKKNLDLIKEIHRLGHDIGLHFDSRFYNIKNKQDLENKIIFEKDILEFYLDINIKSFSFHNPSKFDLKFIDFKYGGLVNTYADFIQSKTEYCSDSNGYWRFDRMIDFIENNKYKSLQLLTHPVWWSNKIKSPKEKIDSNIDDRSKNNKQLQSELLKLYKRENIDW